MVAGMADWNWKQKLAMPTSCLPLTMAWRRGADRIRTTLPPRHFTWPRDRAPWISALAHTCGESGQVRTLETLLHDAAWDAFMVQKVIWLLVPAANCVACVKIPRGGHVDQTRLYSLEQPAYWTLCTNTNMFLKDKKPLFNMVAIFQSLKRIPGVAVTMAAVGGPFNSNPTDFDWDQVICA